MGDRISPYLINQAVTLRRFNAFNGCENFQAAAWYAVNKVSLSE
jgi:hypothetical protein